MEHVVVSSDKEPTDSPELSERQQAVALRQASRELRVKSRQLIVTNQRVTEQAAAVFARVADLDFELYVLAAYPRQP